MIEPARPADQSQAGLHDPRAVPTQIDVVLDWFEELRAKVPLR